jgi:hypothetical protein
MMDEISLGATPAEEKCAQVGSQEYSERARTECAVYRRQLIRQYKAEHECEDLPEGCSLRIASHSHDFGSYQEVAVRYNDSFPEAVDAAFWFDANLPGHWDEDAKKELQELIPNWNNAA